VNARPCSAYWGEKTVQNTATPDGTVLPSSSAAFAPCGYAGAQLQLRMAWRLRLVPATMVVA
jgi:hypothetical protein